MSSFDSRVVAGFQEDPSLHCQPQPCVFHQSEATALHPDDPLDLFFSEMPNIFLPQAALNSKLSLVGNTFNNLQKVTSIDDQFSAAPASAQWNNDEFDTKSCNNYSSSLKLSHLSSRKTEATISSACGEQSSSSSAAAEVDFFSSTISSIPNSTEQPPHIHQNRQSEQPISNPTPPPPHLFVGRTSCPLPSHNFSKKKRNSKNIRQPRLPIVVCIEDLFYDTTTTPLQNIQTLENQSDKLNETSNLQPPLDTIIAPAESLTNASHDKPPLSINMRTCSSHSSSSSTTILPIISHVHSINEQASRSSSSEGEIIKPSGCCTIHVSEDTGTDDEDNKDIRKAIKLQGMKQISFIDVWVRVKTMDLSKERRLIMSLREKRHNSSSSVILRFLARCSVSQPSKTLSLSLRNEKEQVLAFSLVPFEVFDALHRDIAYSVYCGLRQTDFCPLNGAHWLSLGCKHTQIKRNFTIAGVFGAVQILAFIFCYKEYMIDVFTAVDEIHKKNDEARMVNARVSVDKAAGVTTTTGNEQLLSNQQHYRSFTQKNDQSKNNCQEPTRSNRSGQQSMIGSGSETAVVTTVTAASTISSNNNLHFRQKDINLCIVLQDISKQVIIWLERGLLDDLIAIEHGAMNAVNKIFFATFFIFFKRFQKENAGFLSISIAYKAAIDTVQANPAAALHRFKKDISYHYKFRE